MKRFARVALGLWGLAALVYGCGVGNGGENGESAGGDAGTDATTSGDATVACGNGVVDPGEECDQGAQNGTGTGCTSGCLWTCIAGDPTRGNAACSDGNPCDGVETCTAQHTCVAGTPEANGTSCGTSELCNNQKCAKAVCGDGIVTPPEECDDGNNVNGDGCDDDCTFSCDSTAEPQKSCTPADPCAGQGTCNDATHVCSAGTALGDGTPCETSPDGGIAGTEAGVPTTDAGGAASVCKSGTCTPAACGDGVVDGNEQCDFGADNAAGSGCEVNCTFSCAKTPTDSCAAASTDICGGTHACTTVTDPLTSNTGQKCVVGADPPPGTGCGAGDAGTCGDAGSCVTSNCGNGVVDPGEECDFGPGQNTHGSGCEPDCRFSCEKASATTTDTCPNSDACGPSPQACGPVTVGGHAGQKCGSVAQLGACAACGSVGGVCVSAKCSSWVCGDGCTDTAKGGTCATPNTPTCDKNCHSIICGDGVLEGNEQCDDGNLINLDGCDSTCKFEQDHRANTVNIQYAPDPSNPYCTKDALGGAIDPLAQGTVTSSLTGGVDDGSTTIAFKFMGIDDLTGKQQDAGLSLGGMGGYPITDAGKEYDGSSTAPDWWYATSPVSITSTRDPKSLMPATFGASQLEATGTLDVTVTIAGQLALLHTTGTHITAQVKSTSAPTISQDGKTPGHLPGEHDAPGLVTFDQLQNGVLCGNIGAASLASVPVPASLQTGGAHACDQGYGPSNHFLDVMVNGCTVGFGIFTLIHPTNPDATDPTAPLAGTGLPYVFGVTGNTVTSCTSAGKPATLSACLASGAYSSYFTFTTERVIMK